MTNIIKINHVAVALGYRCAFIWRDALGIPLHHIEDVPSQKRAWHSAVGDSEVELIRRLKIWPAKFIKSAAVDPSYAFRLGILTRR